MDTERETKPRATEERVCVAPSVEPREALLGDAGHILLCFLLFSPLLLDVLGSLCVARRCGNGVVWSLLTHDKYMTSRSRALCGAVF